MVQLVTVKDLQREFGVSARTAKRYRAQLRQVGLLTPVTLKGYRTTGNMVAIRAAILGGKLRYSQQPSA